MDILCALCQLIFWNKLLSHISLVISVTDKVEKYPPKILDIAVETEQQSLFDIIKEQKLYDELLSKIINRDKLHLVDQMGLPCDQLSYEISSDLRYYMDSVNLDTYKFLKDKNITVENYETLYHCLIKCNNPEALDILKLYSVAYDVVIDEYTVDLNKLKWVHAQGKKIRAVWPCRPAWRRARACGCFTSRAAPEKVFT